MVTKKLERNPQACENYMDGLNFQPIDYHSFALPLELIQAMFCLLGRSTRARLDIVPSINSVAPLSNYEIQKFQHPDENVSQLQRDCFHSRTRKNNFPTFLLFRIVIYSYFLID